MNKKTVTGGNYSMESSQVLIFNTSQLKKLCNYLSHDYLDYLSALLPSSIIRTGALLPPESMMR